MELYCKQMVLLGMSFCLIGSVDGEEWTRFRGPDGAGQSDATTIPAVWTNQDYKWRVEVPGKGHSSPVVSGKQVFVTSAIQKDATKIVRALRSSDGSLLWEVRFPSSLSDLGRSSSYDTASPTVDAERIYAAWASPQGYIVVALDRHSGQEVWRRDLGAFQGDHGFGASPILFEDLVILANDQNGPSSTVALDSRTGRTRWLVERRAIKSAYSTPIIYRPEGGPAQLVLTSTSHGVSSFDPHTGKLNWEVADVFGKLRVVGSPVAAGGLIFAQCGVGGGGERMVAIKPPDPGSHSDARVVYEIEGSLPYAPTPVTHGKWLFLISDGGVASCIDIETGQRVWRERVGGNFYGSAVRAGNRIYFMSRAGEMVVLAAAPEFQLAGTSRLRRTEPQHTCHRRRGDVPPDLFPPHGDRGEC